MAVDRTVGEGDNRKQTRLVVIGDADFGANRYVAQGFNADLFQGKPVIGICNSWSELNNCNLHLRQVAEGEKQSNGQFIPK